MTTTATEAAVTTLTAEVRTLVVGTRQVTLSVAKQLDVVHIVDLRVMGRVRLNGDHKHVIGTAADGSLALARYSEPWYPRPRFIDADDLTGKATVCQSLQADDYYPLEIGGENFRLARGAAEQCTVEEHARWSQQQQKCDGWTAPPEVMAQIATVVRGKILGEQIARAAHKAAAAAPLIVLAGLK